MEDKRIKRKIKDVNQIIRLYFKEKSLGKTGKILNVSRERVSQLLEDAGYDPDFLRKCRLKETDRQILEILLENKERISKIIDLVVLCREKGLNIGRIKAAIIFRSCGLNLYKGLHGEPFIQMVRSIKRSKFKKIA